MSPALKTNALKTPARLPGGRTLPALILGFYLMLCLSAVFTLRPQTDESVYANPGYNLLYNGRMGTTVYELRGFMPLSMAERTYWQPPLYFVTTALWYRMAGFGLIQTRLLSVLFGVLALYSWNVIARSLFGSFTLGWVVTGLVSIDYFFLLGASQGRMDMMCAALGIAAIAAYLKLRKHSFQSAIFWGHALATMSILTHPVGVTYWLGLGFLILYFDRRLLSLKTVALAAIPCLIGGLSWGAYIAQAPHEFIAQMQGILDLNKQAFEAGNWSSIPFIRNFQKELVFRYVGPFGLNAGTGLAQRLKAFILLAYVVGIAGTLVMSRRNPKVLVFPILTIISFLYIAILSPSKFSYYLPHTTMFLAACFAVYVYHLESWGAARRWALAAVVLFVAAIQVSGLLHRVYEDPYRHSFLPAVAAVTQHSQPGSLVFASGELWFQLQPERRLLHDPKLGFRNGLTPAIFVLDPLYHMLHEQDRVANPPLYSYVKRYIDSSQLVYSDGYYSVYVPQGAHRPAITP